MKNKTKPMGFSGKKFKAALEKGGWTLWKFSKELRARIPSGDLKHKPSSTTVWHWIHGKAPSMVYASLVYAILKVSPEELME